MGWSCWAGLQFGFGYEVKLQELEPLPLSRLEHTLENFECVAPSLFALCSRAIGNDSDAEAELEREYPDIFKLAEKHIVQRADFEPGDDPDHEGEWEYHYNGESNCFDASFNRAALSVLCLRHRGIDNKGDSNTAVRDGSIDSDAESDAESGSESKKRAREGAPPTDPTDDAAWEVWLNDVCPTITKVSSYEGCSGTGPGSTVFIFAADTMKSFYFSERGDIDSMPFQKPTTSFFPTVDHQKINALNTVVQRMGLPVVNAEPCWISGHWAQGG
ncbi:hypothetical protein TrCOL_g5451 [Triparma columacea]|uniref:Uncharacterized protein n=1 Tax=Triparma columacea TaxID=722753 RepID=A0A9W7GPD5_9STRA|nr:hypothetical protein TrCOL_g5451 [Triparma columacea]